MSAASLRETLQRRDGESILNKRFTSIHRALTLPVKLNRHGLRGIRNNDAVAAGSLGPVKRIVRALHHLGGGYVAGAPAGDADRHCDRDRPAVSVDRELPELIKKAAELSASTEAKLETG